MLTNWWTLSTEMARATMEAQHVIALRMAKLAKGGAAADREARRMVIEKVAAFAEASAALLVGKSAHSVVRRYGSIVCANKRRLSKR
jgi:hypothetical protein